MTNATSDIKINKPDGICRMFNGKPLSTHGAFLDIGESQRILSMGSTALKGIGSMLQPLTNETDGHMDVKRSELSDIFSFFGYVLAEHSLVISEAVFRIEQAADGRTI